MDITAITLDVKIDLDSVKEKVNRLNELVDEIQAIAEEFRHVEIPCEITNGGKADA